MTDSKVNRALKAYILMPLLIRILALSWDFKQQSYIKYALDPNLDTNSHL